MHAHIATMQELVDEKMGTYDGTHEENPTPPTGIMHKIMRPFKDFHTHLSTTQAFADHFAKKLDSWVCLIRFLAFILITILIFVINAKKFGNSNANAI